MAKVRVELKLDHLRELTYEGPMSAMLWGKAQAVHSVARARAPVVTGHYRSSFRMAFADTDRNVARVYNDADYALALEYGNSDSPSFRTLGNALDAAGGA
jgi:hypothetical protein